MKLDSLSKECVIIGSLSLTLSLVLITIEIKELIKYLESEYNFKNRSNLIKEHCHKLVAFVAMTLFSIFIILGIRKRNALLMAPWLLAAFACVTFTIFLIVGNLMTLPFGHLEFILFTIAVIGMESVVLYPLCTLFDEIRRERANKLRRQALNARRVITV